LAAGLSSDFKQLLSEFGISDATQAATAGLNLQAEPFTFGQAENEKKDEKNE
jgi:hypothetical protein